MRHSLAAATGSCQERRICQQQLLTAAHTVCFFCLLVVVVVVVVVAVAVAVAVAVFAPGAPTKNTLYSL